MFYNNKNILFKNIKLKDIFLPFIYDVYKIKILKKIKK